MQQTQQQAPQDAIRGLALCGSQARAVRFDASGPMVKRTNLLLFLPSSQGKADEKQKLKQTKELGVVYLQLTYVVC